MLFFESCTKSGQCGGSNHVVLTASKNMFNNSVVSRVVLQVQLLNTRERPIVLEYVDSWDTIFHQHHMETQVYSDIQ